jgi:hypothetical protein
MKSLLLNVSITMAAVFSMPSIAVAQNYDYCTDRNGDRYYTDTFYEYGRGYPVVLNDIESIETVPSYMSFNGEVTMYSYTEDRQIMMINGEYVDILGLWFEPNCSMQLLVFSPRLRLLGSVPADAVAVPD